MKKTSQIRYCACGCCGRQATIDRWNKEKEGATCLRCHIQELRRAVKQIHEGIQLIYEALSDENNKIKMNLMTSQRKKLLYFQMLEAGKIKFEIK